MTTIQKFIKYAAIALALSIIVGIFSGISQVILGITLITDYKEKDEVLGEMTGYEVSQSIEGLDIDVSSATLKIVSGEKFHVETNFNNMKVEENKNTLKIDETDRNLFNVSNDNGVVVVTVPQNATFDKVKINAGVGGVEIESLICDKLDIDLGVGATQINSLTVLGSADIDSGVGATKILSGEIEDIDLSLGVGKTEINAVITGKSNIEAGMGELKLTIPADKENYTVKVETGIGDFKVDGEKVEDNAVIGDGSNELTVEGGIGRVTIDFE